MSERNKIVLLRVFNEVFNEHRLDLIPELYVENCMGCDPANPEDIIGRKDLIQLLENYRAAFPKHKYEVHEIISEDDIACVRWTVDLYGDTPGKDEMKIEGLSLCAFSGGKIDRVWQHWDNLGFLKTLGAVDADISVASAVGSLVS